MVNSSAAIRFLQDYVAIPSVNPMGRDDVPAAILGETRLAEHLHEQLRGMGLDSVLVGEGARKSVVAEATAGLEAETILVASHIDTVPIDGMRIEPFSPLIESGRLFGRGACDTKAGMAALVAALARVLASGRLRRNVIVVGEADEELSSRGVRDVLEHLGGRRPDWVLATEPTELCVIRAHKGVVHARLEAEGVACHASEPELGRNAIVALSRAALAMDALSERLARNWSDAMLGRSTLSIGMISGGHAPNVVPSRAHLIADLRTLPGQSLDDVRGEIESALEDHGASGVRLTQLSLEKPPLGTEASHGSVRACLAAARAAGHPPQVGGVAFGTDAGVFEAAGVPGVVLGPGSIRRAHTAEEFVELDQVEAMTEIFVHLLASSG